MQLSKPAEGHARRAMAVGSASLAEDEAAYPAYPPRSGLVQHPHIGSIGSEFKARLKKKHQLVFLLFEP
jgi:hypothetical protein